MDAKQMIPLPKLPHGEGTMAYGQNGNIIYKKWILLADGSKYRRTITASNIADCFKKMMEEEKKAAHAGSKGEIRGQYSSRLDHEILYWLNNIKKNTLKVQSWERLDSTIRNNILPSPIAKQPISKITSKNIQHLINMMNSGDYSYSSIKKTYDCLNDFFRYVALRDEINNPMLSVVCVMKANVIKEQKEVEYFDEEDIRKFRVQALSTWKSSGRPRYRYGAVLVANLYMGLRIGELLALRWNDVDFEKGYVMVNKTLIEERNPKYDPLQPDLMKKKEIKKNVFRVQKSTKTSKNRKVPMNKAAAKYLQCHYERSTFIKKNDFVISTSSGKSTTTKNIQDTIKSILKNADTKTQASNTHIMRHTCATLLFDKGIDLHTIAQILGNSEEVLKKTYVHFNDDKLAEIMEMIADIELKPEFFWKPKEEVICVKYYVSPIKKAVSARQRLQ